MSAPSQTQTKARPGPAFPPRPSNILQRKCACGASPGLDGACAECRGKRLTSQRQHLAPGMLQTKLTVNQPDDAYEQEADRVADQVMRVGQPGAADSQRITPITGDGCIHRLGAACENERQRPSPGEEDEEETVQRKEVSPGTPEIPRDIQSHLGHLQGGGQSLSSDLRAFFEPRFGHDFGQVRIHTDSRAAATARALDARAFTMGRDIVFAAGQYAPHSPDGRRLLAHELTHTLQQRAPGEVPRLQRVCDPAVLARTEPIFFPRQTTIVQIFAGTERLRSGTTRFAAVGLVQQALVDMGFDLGTSGPNRDGVDRIFGTKTKQAVSDFQTTESVPGATPGEVDQATLKCLDEVRAHKVIPQHLAATVAEPQFLVGGESGGVRDEDIFFGRGSAVLDANDKAKIGRLATAQKGCALTLRGFISEEERVDFGAQLATDRLNAVDAEFAAAGHDSAGVCTPPAAPAPPLRTLQPMPEASGGLPTYRGRRKVEVVPSGATPTTAVCGTGAARQRPLDALENPLLTASITDALALIDTARGKLVVGDVDGDAALSKFFNGVAQRSSVRSKLQTWRNHIHTVIRSRNQRGTDCDPGCSAAIAYNIGTGGGAMMTLCGSFFGTTIDLYPALTTAQNRTLVLIHEAGHGALGTEDIAYDTDRLIHFIGRLPSVALKNTDSFVTLIRCLSGLLPGCTLPARGDTPIGMGAAELESAQEGIAWLESWLTWAEQDVNGLYSDMNEARTSPSAWSSSYYAAYVLPPLAMAFDLHRPLVGLPTFREQTMVAAVWDRYRLMRNVASSDLEIEKDTSAAPVQRWQAGAGLAPGTKVFLTDTYLDPSRSRRSRVEMLLPMIVEATPSIDPALRPAYVTFVKETVRRNWDNRP
jgi:hypothetical protein